jgi:hypothetical protein
MVDNKRGQQMTLGTIIAIVLGIAVLVFLIFGFSTGWSNLWDRVTAFGGSANVDTIVQACALKCSTEDKYGFCEESRTVKYGKEVTIGDAKVKSSDGTCNDMTNNVKYPGVGVAPCPSLC